MKQIAIKPTNFILWIVLCGILSSYSIPLGGDSYTIYLGDRLLSEQFVARQTNVPNVFLQESSPQDKISVYYSHCGLIGKKRTLAVKDEHSRMLKTWSFEDVVADHTPMIINASEVNGLFNKGHKTLTLIYSSVELPQGRTLATIASSKQAGL